MKIDSTEDVLQKEPGYDLEKTLDLGRAKDSLKVIALDYRSYTSNFLENRLLYVFGINCWLNY